MGKPDYDAVEEFGEFPSFRHSLGIEVYPFRFTFRQRLYVVNRSFDSYDAPDSFSDAGLNLHDIKDYA